VRLVTPKPDAKAIIEAELRFPRLMRYYKRKIEEEDERERREDERCAVLDAAQECFRKEKALNEEAWAKLKAIHEDLAAGNFRDPSNGVALVYRLQLEDLLAKKDGDMDDPTAKLSTTAQTCISPEPHDKPPDGD